VILRDLRVGTTISLHIPAFLKLSPSKAVSVIMIVAKLRISKCSIMHSGLVQTVAQPGYESLKFSLSLRYITNFLKIALMLRRKTVKLVIAILTPLGSGM
jgi:hypothetical protein